MKIVYIGELNHGGTCLQRRDSLIRLGVDVYSINTYSSLNFSLLGKFFYKINFPIDFNLVNFKLFLEVVNSRYDLIWIDKGVMILPFLLKTIRYINKKIKLVSYSPDDMFNKKNQSWFYLKSIKIYNYHLTTKSFNVDEFYLIGAQKVIYLMKGYDPYTHFKIQNIELNKKILVGHVGQFEKERFESMLFLAENNIKVHLFGPGWEEYIGMHENLIVNSGFFLGDSYRELLNLIQINLCFLRKTNRDLHTSRSIEIPACGSFMLAERTTEHLDLFKEDIEAAYFSNNYELLFKVKYYLENIELVDKIAANGYYRCLNDDYSIDRRLEIALGEIRK